MNKYLCACVYTYIHICTHVMVKYELDHQKRLQFAHVSLCGMISV